MPPVIGNIIAIAAIALVVFFAARSVIRDFKSGGCSGCSGGCGSCGHACNGHCSGTDNLHLSKKQIKEMNERYQAYLKEKEQERSEM